MTSTDSPPPREPSSEPESREEPLRLTPPLIVLGVVALLVGILAGFLMSAKTLID